MDNNDSFATRLKQLRQKMNLSQRDFAESLGISAMSISTYESNTKSPSIETVIKIANTYNVSIDWLCGLRSISALNEKPQNYSDIIRLLFKIEESNIDGFKMDSFIDQFNIQTTNISFRDDFLYSFVNEWKKMYDVHKQQIIDDEMYDLWIEKTLKKYDKPITHSCFLNIPDDIDEERPFN